jgi:hypothetical protein
MRLIALAVGLWGCAAPAADPAAPPPDPTDIVPTDPAPSGDELLAEAEQVASQGLAVALTLDPDAIEASYDQAMALGDEACPSEYGGYWFDSCDTSSGATFDGFAFEFTDGGYGYYWSVYGEAVIGRPDGSFVILAGYAGWGDYSYAGTDISYHYAYGTFVDEGAKSWLGGDHDMGLFVEAGTDASGDRHFAVDGTLGTIDGNRAHAVDFEAFSVNEPGFDGAVCATDAPTGVLFVRTDSGTWVQLNFADRCDGCADAFDGEERLGEVCLDTSAFLDWEVTPW